MNADQIDEAVQKRLAMADASSIKSLYSQVKQALDVQTTRARNASEDAVSGHESLDDVQKYLTSLLSAVRQLPQL